MPSGPYYEPSPGAEATSIMLDLSETGSLDYDFGADLVDIDGNQLRDVSTNLVAKDQGNIVPTVVHDCTADVAGDFQFETLDTFAWGADIIAPYLYIRAFGYRGGEWLRFPVGHFVMTSPQAALLDGFAQQVTAYEKNYLLQGDVGQTFYLPTGSTYTSGIANLFNLAGISAALVGGELSMAYLTFPGDLPVKTTPIDLVYPCDDANNYTYLQVINALLAAAGCLPLFTDQGGRWTIRYLPKPITQASQWLFSRTANLIDVNNTFPTQKTILEGGPSAQINTLTRDVHGVVNQWVFIQSGLDFAPVEGSGQYTVNNAPGQPHYLRPSDQLSVRRVIKSMQHLTASGQPDLVAQGEAIVTAAQAQAEQLNLLTAPWPCAGHYDVFQYGDLVLPDTDGRKAQAQSWRLPLNGDPMTWLANVVAPQ